MDIKEFYISDVNGNTYDGEFWSEDKLLKLNENFNRLSNGLHAGPTGVGGSMGISGPAGIVGASGIVGVAGAGGIVGGQGLNLWERLDDSTQSPQKSKLTTRNDKSIVIVGLLMDSTPEVVQTGTFVETGTGVKPSVLRINTVDKVTTHPNTSLAVAWDANIDQTITVGAAYGWPDSGVVDIGGNIISYASITPSGGNYVLYIGYQGIHTLYSNTTVYAIGTPVYTKALNQRKHITLSKSGSATVRSHIGFLESVANDQPTLRIASEKQQYSTGSEINLKASNFTIGSDTHTSGYFTDNGIILQPANVVFFGNNLSTPKIPCNVNITGDVIATSLATIYSATTLIQAWDPSTDTTIKVAIPVGGSTWSTAGTATVTDGSVSNVVDYTNLVDNGSNYTLTVVAAASANQYVIGNGVTIPAGNTTGFAIKSVHGYNTGTGTGYGNVALVDVTSNYNSFPYGSIISMTQREYIENFLNNYQDTLRYTGTPTGSSIGQGFESEHGKGFGNYEGWYLCNGRQWQTIHLNNVQPGFQQYVPKLVNTNYQISTDSEPNTYGNEYYAITGSKLEITKATGAQGDISIEDASGADPMHSYLLQDGGQSFLWDHNYYISTGFAGEASLNNTIHVVWLGRGDLYWYTNPPMVASNDKN